jgi:hypothetical protein
MPSIDARNLPTRTKPNFDVKDEVRMRELESQVRAAETQPAQPVNYKLRPWVERLAKEAAALGNFRLAVRAIEAGRWEPTGPNGVKQSSPWKQRLLEALSKQAAANGNFTDAVLALEAGGYEPGDYWKQTLMRELSEQAVAAGKFDGAVTAIMAGGFSKAETRRMMRPIVEGLATAAGDHKSATQAHNQSSSLTPSVDSFGPA